MENKAGTCLAMTFSPSSSNKNNHNNAAEETTAKKKLGPQKTFVSCDLCNYVAEYKLHLTKHIKKRHPEVLEMDEYTKCAKCQTMIANEAFKRHIKRCAKKQIFPCNFCEITSIHVVTMKRHVRSAHPDIDKKEVQDFINELQETAKIYAAQSGMECSLIQFLIYILLFPTRFVINHLPVITGKRRKPKSGRILSEGKYLSCLNPFVHKKIAMLIFRIFESIEF